MDPSVFGRQEIQAFVRAFALDIVEGAAAVVDVQLGTPDEAKQLQLAGYEEIVSVPDVTVPGGLKISLWIAHRGFADYPDAAEFTRAKVTDIVLGPLESAQLSLLRYAKLGTTFGKKPLPAADTALWIQRSGSTVPAVLDVTPPALSSKRADGWEVVHSPGLRAPSQGPLVDATAVFALRRQQTTATLRPSEKGGGRNAALARIRRELLRLHFRNTDLRQHLLGHAEAASARSVTVSTVRKWLREVGAQVDSDVRAA